MSIPPEVPQKKGMSCLGIGGIGCLVILIVVFVVGGILVAKFGPKIKEAMEEYQRDAKSSPDKAAAKLGIKVIPNVQIVREDDVAKTITFKAGESGEEMTMHYDGITTGKQPKVTNSKGEVMDTSGTAPAPAETPPPQN